MFDTVAVALLKLIPLPHASIELLEIVEAKLSTLEIIIALLLHPEILLLDISIEVVSFPLRFIP